MSIVHLLQPNSRAECAPEDNLWNLTINDMRSMAGGLRTAGALAVHTVALSKIYQADSYELSEFEAVVPPFSSEELAEFRAGQTDVQLAAGGVRKQVQRSAV